MEGWDKHNLQTCLLHILVTVAETSHSLWPCPSTSMKPDTLDAYTLAAFDSRPENDQQTAVTRGQKSLLTRACLTLLIQAISSFYHARLSGFPPHPLATHVHARAHRRAHESNTSVSTCLCIYEIVLILFGFKKTFVQNTSIISLPKRVCFFYLVAVYTLHNERNDFVCYSEILQHWVHCCVCGEVREQFNMLTINNCIILSYLLFLLV